MALSGSETPGNGANVCLIDRVTLFYCFKKYIGQSKKKHRDMIDKKFPVKKKERFSLHFPLKNRG